MVIRPPQGLQPLTPAIFHILLALADGEKHGYAIMEEVMAMTNGKLKLGPGTLYGSIKQMLEMDFIYESDERPDLKLNDEHRRYYRLTSLGGQVVRAESRRLSARLHSTTLKPLIESSHS